MAEARIIAATDYRRERWRNGAGWTQQIHAEPALEPGQDWGWRLSIAEIEAEVHALLPPHDRLRFAGERPLHGELVDGPTRDFNLMWRRDAIDAQLWHRPLVGTMAVFVEPGETWAVYLVAGQVDFAGGEALPPLRAGDTALLASDERRRFLLDGTGEALVMRLAPRAQ